MKIVCAFFIFFSVLSSFCFSSGLRRLTPIKSGAAFSPADVTGLTAWYKADSLVASDNDTITSWTDSSGNGYTSTSSTGPTYKTNILNGKPVLRFNGTDQYMGKAGDTDFDTNIISASAYSSYSVFLLRADGPSEEGTYYSTGAIWIQATDVNTGLGLGSTAGTNTLWYGNYDGGTVDNFTTGVSLTTKYLATQKHGGGTLYGRLNGAAVSSTASGNTTTATTPVIIGANNYSNKFVQADIAEIIFYNVLNSDADTLLIEEYLRAKYSVY